MPFKMASAMKAKRGFHIPGEAFLIAFVVILMAVMLHHVYETWAASNTPIVADDPRTGITFTHNFTGDPLADSGWWGKQTSAMNFCEEDYTVTASMAEFINVISNLSYMYLSWTTWPKGAKWPPVTNMAFFLVGMTSAVFHASLRHYTQIADEIGMYLLTASLDWYLYSYPGAIFSGKVSKPVFGTLMWGVCAAVVYINFTAGGADFGIHTMLFIALLTGLWPRCLYLIAERRKAEKAGVMPAGAIEAKTLRRKFRIGASYFLLGFALWVVDCAFCYELRSFRERVGLPLAWLSEMHGWWHVLTALGAAAFVELTAIFSSEEQGNVRVKDKRARLEVNGRANGHSNGHVNGVGKRLK